MRLRSQFDCATGWRRARASCLGAANASVASFGLSSSSPQSAVAGAIPMALSEPRNRPRSGTVGRILWIRWIWRRPRLIWSASGLILATTCGFHFVAPSGRKLSASMIKFASIGKLAARATGRRREELIRAAVGQQNQLTLSPASERLSINPARAACEPAPDLEPPEDLEVAQRPREVERQPAGRAVRSITGSATRQSMALGRL